MCRNITELRGLEPAATPQEVEAMEQDDPRGDVVIYWRPGCGFCAMLKARLGRLRDRATWVNIWDDEEAAAFVRSVNDGNETVPTVRIGDQVHTNPEPDLVRAALR